MAAAGFSWVSLLFLMLSAGGGDLLDLIGTDAFWKSKGVAVTYENMTAELASEESEDVSGLLRELGSDDFAVRDQAQTKLRAMGRKIVPQLRPTTQAADAEIASRAHLLLQQIQSDDKALAIRRLMAIRALGEMKEAKALALLEKLKDSPEQFVAAYAARAIAAIQGQPLPRRDSGEALASDLALLPANCGVIARFEFQFGAPLTLRQLIEKLPQDAGQDPEEMLAEMTGRLIGLAEKVGNLRLDGVTAALSDDVGDEEGFAIAVVRGEYDAVAVAEAIAGAGEMEKLQRGPVTLLEQRNMRILLPSPDRLIFVGGPNNELLPTDGLLAAIESGKGTLHESVAMGDVLKQIDTSKPLWIAAAMNDHYRQLPLLAPLDSIRLVGDIAGEKLNLRLDATGHDAAAVKAVADEFTDGVADAARELREVVTRHPDAPVAPLVELLDSIQCTTDGPAVTVTGSANLGVGSFIGFPLFWGMSFERQIEGIEQ